MNKIIMEIACLCGNEYYKIIRNDMRYQLIKDRPPAKIIKCIACGLARTSPVPALSEFYNELDKGYLHTLENEDLWRGFAQNILSEISRYKTSGELLDIGCGIGILVDEAKRRGYRASGLEINPSAASTGIKRYGLSIYNFHVEQLCASDKRWDVIILNHVLEHIIEPVQFLSNCRKLLKQNGIVFIGVPSYTGWTAFAEGKNWYAYGVDQHIWHWTKKTISCIIEKGGLSISHIHSKRNNHYHFGGVRGKIKWALYRFFEMIGKGDQIIIIAK